MRRSTLLPVLLAAGLAWACGGPAPGDVEETGQVGVAAPEDCGDDCTECSLGLEEVAVDASADAVTEPAAAAAAEAGPAAELMTVRLAVMGMG